MKNNALYLKTLGLIGGMSWESTVPYYQIINRTIQAKLGGLHSAKLLLHSVDFADIAELQRSNQWDKAAVQLTTIAQNLAHAGAQALVICTNTMHKLADEVQAGIPIPLLHIADPTAQAIKAAGFHTVGLLGTRFTMEQDFYRSRLENTHGLTVLTPPQPERDAVHRIIFDELCLGKVQDASRHAYQQIIANLQAQGAQAVILGCTEIAMLVRPQDCAVPLFDTTTLHATHAARWAMA
ncbi:aspartate/glutamate racemase family protein [Rhodoferax sp.]|uniref:aspartate/glutamate racemase family protein n=1 Tax=Rhodoferax sp. TaxID=50421 RepID=UPI00263207E4|nr:aspartate/glutamate racemase family protein [Rhodoferax sp.]MDD5478597.1 aspartate/glutamate racemase family protein [Rhodoferax sp.]